MYGRGQGRTCGFASVAAPTAAEAEAAACPGPDPVAPPRLQVRFVHCLFTTGPSSAVLECGAGSEVEAHGCLFQSDGKHSSGPSTPAVDVTAHASFSAKHCVWRGLPASLCVKSGSAVAEECLFQAKGALRATDACITVSGTLALRPPRTSLFPSRRFHPWLCVRLYNTLALCLLTRVHVPNCCAATPLHPSAHDHHGSVAQLQVAGSASQLDLKRCWVEASRAVEQGAGPEGSSSRSITKPQQQRQQQLHEVHKGICVVKCTKSARVSLDRCTLLWAAAGSHATAHASARGRGGGGGVAGASALVATVQGGQAKLSHCELLAEHDPVWPMPQGFVAQEGGSVIVRRSLLSGCAGKVEQGSTLLASHTVMQAQGHRELPSLPWASPRSGAGGAAAETGGPPAAGTTARAAASGGDASSCSGHAAKGTGAGLRVIDSGVITLSSCTIEGFEVAVQVGSGAKQSHLD